MATEYVRFAGVTAGSLIGSRRFVYVPDRDDQRA
jgi:hypothetical protein